MLQCGTIDDVYSYEKMKNQRSSASPQSARLGHKKTMSFRDSAPQSPTSAKLSSKKTSSFRWISRQSDGALGSSKRAGTQDVKESSISPSSMSKKPKDTPKRIGFIDILLGYHSLLYSSPAYPGATQRKELHPTIGFIRNPDYGTQS